jgi:glucan phosphoethanolaminetransferase (alkaline phosphatase superfamily)
VGNALETAAHFFGIAFKIILATAILLTFHLLFSAPWLFIVWVVARYTRELLAPRLRFLLLSGLAAAGVAPFFGSHASPFPMYLRFLGHNTNPPKTLISDLESVLVTWGLFLLVGFGVARYRAFRARISPKKEMEE